MWPRNRHKILKEIKKRKEWLILTQLKDLDAGINEYDFLRSQQVQSDLVRKKEAEIKAKTKKTGMKWIPFLLDLLKKPVGFLELIRKRERLQNMEMEKDKPIAEGTETGQQTSKEKSKHDVGSSER